MSQEQTSPVLIGKSDILEITDPELYPWFNANYESYKPDVAALENLKKALSADASFLVFGGTWCSDTHSLLPKFYKALDEAGVSRNSVELYFLDEKKNSPEELEKKYGVNNVPSFIVLNQGNEMGRVVETVEQSIEGDLVKVFQK